MPKIYSEQFKLDLKACVDAYLEEPIKFKDDRKKVDWQEIQERLIDIDPSYRLNKAQIRAIYQRLTGGTLKVFQGVSENKLQEIADRQNIKTKALEEQLLYIITKSKVTLEYLETLTKTSVQTILGTLTQLQFSGYPNIIIWKENGVLMAHNKKSSPIVSEDAYDLSDKYEGREIKFMVVSDTHIGSDKSRLDALHWAYQYAHNQGIREVYHAGDITDGFYTNRMTSIKEQDGVGFQEQLKLVVDHYPRVDGMTTYYITGNHDITHMRNGFADLGETLAMVRPDMVYLGHNFAKVYLTERTTMSLVHPTDGSANTLSLKLQKLIDNNPKRKADLMFVGHYHKSLRMKYKGSYGFLVPSFQDQTSFMLDNNLASDVGATIIHIKVDHDGRIIGLHDTYLDLSDMGGVRDAYKEGFRK